jgi:hypothetical protein
MAAASRDGRTEALVLAHGLTVEMLADSQAVFTMARAPSDEMLRRSPICT